MLDQSPLQILIIEDSFDDAHLLVHGLKRGGVRFEYERVETEAEFEAALDRREWDIILSDHSMPGFTGYAALHILQSRGLDIPFIIVSGLLGEDAAVDAMRAGADDFFLKHNTQRLVPAIEREVADARERHQRRRAEAQLRESEQLFAKAFLSSPVGITITTLDEGTFVDVNPAYERLTGYTRDELIGRRVDELAMRVDGGHRSQTVQEIDQLGAIHNRESVLRARDGSLRHVLVSLERISLGDKACMLAMLYDMTEQKQAAAAEQEQRAYASALRETAALLAGSLDLTTVMATLLEHIERVVPYDAALILLVDSAQAFIGYQRGYFPENDALVRYQRFELDDPILTTVDEDRSAVTQQTGMGAGWSQVAGHEWVRATITARIVAQDRLVGFVVLHRDATGAYSPDDVDHLRAFADHAAMAIRNAQLYSEVQHHADELERRVEERTHQLRRAKEQAEAILNNTGDALFLADAAGTIVQSNPAFEHLFGRRPTALRHVSQLTRPDAPALLTDAIIEVLTTGQTGRIDLDCQRHDGEPFTAEVTIAPAVRQDDDLPMMICSVRDITHRKVLESELRAALMKEKELRELKSRFVAMITHEFRTPLAAIQSSGDILSHYAERLDTHGRAIHINGILEQVRHLVTLLEDILVIGKAEVVGLDFKPVRTDLEALCRALVDEIARVAVTHSFEVRILGNCQDALIDRALIRQILLNLLSNAAKYSAPGSAVEITIASEPAGYRLEVRDHGIGIPPADLTRLYEIFHRGSNVGEVSGTGLGLALAKLAVEAHGGSMTVASQLDAGSTFTVTIPHLVTAQE